jgi:hypothetical protein
MANRSHVKVVLSLDDRKKLVTFFQILMVVDKQVKTKKAAKKSSKVKESKMKSKIEDKIACKHTYLSKQSWPPYSASIKRNLTCRAPKNKTGALSFLKHVRYDGSYAIQSCVYH